MGNEKHIVKLTTFKLETTFQYTMHHSPFRNQQTWQRNWFKIRGSNPKGNPHLFSYRIGPLSRQQSIDEHSWWLITPQ